jgi:hypothetical protein
LVEADADSIVHGEVRGEFVVAAVRILHEGVTGTTVGADASRWSPRIGRSREPT